MKLTPHHVTACARLLAVDAYFFAFSGAYRAAPWLLRHAPEQRLAGLAARLHFSVAARQRRRSTERLAACLAEDPASPTIAALSRQAFRHRWATAEPNALLRLASDTALRRRLCAAVEAENLARLSEALARGRGAILWSSPFGQPLLTRAALHDLGLPLYHLHEAAGTAPPEWFHRFPFRRRYRAAEASLVAGVVDVERGSFAYLRKVRRWLAQNRAVLVNALGRNGQTFVECEFLGTKRRFATGSVSLARATGAAILPIFCFEDENRRPRLVVETPIEMDRSGDRQAAAAAILQDYASLLEGYIRRHPGQWPCWHAGG